MNKETERDVEKSYPKSDFISKLRRLADSLEKGERLKFKLLVKGYTFPFVQHTVSSTNEKTARKKLSFK